MKMFDRLARRGLRVKIATDSSIKPCEQQTVEHAPYERPKIIILNRPNG